jgi:hypothetical protein
MYDLMLTHTSRARLLQPTDDRAVLYEQAQQILRRDGADRPTLSLSVSLGQTGAIKHEPVRLPPLYLLLAAAVVASSSPKTHQGVQPCLV